MKKHKLNIMRIMLFLLVFICGEAWAATNEILYLMNGHPTPKGDVQFPSSLYRVDTETKSLQLVREVVPVPNGTDAIHADYDKGLIVLRVWGSSYSEDGMEHVSFKIVDMGQPKSDRVVVVDFPKEWSIDPDTYYLEIPGRGLYFSIALRKLNKDKTHLEWQSKGISLATDKLEELPWHAYGYFRVSGLTGGGVYPSDFFTNIGPDQDGKLKISVAGQLFNPSPEYLNDLTFKWGNRVSVYINNDKILVLSANVGRVRDTKGLGHTTFHVYNKSKKKWGAFNVQGGNTVGRGFGPWVVGYVADQWRDTPIPGYEKRSNKGRKTGLSIDWLFKDDEIYSPGILFLYNADTDKKYQIQTDQGDNEVLFVENDTVYYRAYDEIYKARIGKNKIEDAVLLVKYDVVPDIHWAFMGPE